MMIYGLVTLGFFGCVYTMIAFMFF